MPASGPTEQAEVRHVLVVANETVGGGKLLEAIRERAERGPIRCTVICPQDVPPKGLVRYDKTSRSVAQIRLDLTLRWLREMGIEVEGGVMDPDPFVAVKGAVREWGPDEIIISTRPYPRSGWLHRDLVKRIADHSKLPVEHVMVDLEDEPETHVLVVANQTVGSHALIEILQRRAMEAPHRFTIICPIGATDQKAERAAAERLRRTLGQLHAAGIEAVGQVMYPDPLASVSDVMQHQPADEVVISTFPKGKSRWLSADLVNMVRGSVGRPVEHVVVDPDAEQMVESGTG